MNAKQIKSLARQFIENETSDIRYFTLRGSLRKHLPEIADIQTDYDGNKILSFYLGSLINPSGKFYTPWANSNVDACPRCKGTGKGKLIPHDTCNGTGKRYIEDIRAMGFTPLWADIFEGRKDVLIDEKGEYIDCYCQKGNEYLDCAFCGGLGSREAFEDSIFWEWLDHYAEKHGGDIQSGEGDPCDTFLSFTIEVNEE